MAIFTTTNPSLQYPGGVSLDDADNLYIADTFNSRIVKLNSTTGDELAVFTTSNPSLRLPQDIALDDSGNMYIMGMVVLSR